MLAFKEETGSVVNFPGSTPISNEDVLVYDCDILIPAALECQITTANARDVKAKLIVEDANGPLTAVADEVLHQKGIVVLPDILANAGGVVVSYFEWVQNLENQKWSLEKVETRLNERMCRAVDEVVDIYDQLSERYKAGENKGRPGPTLRDAALVLAMKRIATVVLQRDIWP